MAIATATGPVPPAARIGRALLLAASDDPAVRSVQAALQRAGYRTRILVDSGRHGADQWIAQLGLRSAEPGDGRILLVHATLLDAPARVRAADLDRQLAAGVEVLFATLRAAAAVQRRLRVPVRLAVLGRGLVDVTGGESVNPASAAVLGLLRSAELEVPGLRCQLVDVGDRPAESALSDALAGEDPLIAVRGAVRWSPWLAESVSTPVAPAVRERGIYLVTGGLGGIGLVLARALAESGARPNLVLVGRTEVASRADRAAVEQQLAALEEAGATVLAFGCDVTDTAALARVADAVETRLGPVNGVVHAAGVPGGGLLEPKAAGVLTIDEVFADRAPLDFLVLCSSLAGATGMYGSADYAAANAFLDAYSVSRSSARRRTISVQWPGWAEVGMLARSPEGRAVLNGSSLNGSSRPPTEPADPDAALEEVLVPGANWQLDEHIFDGVSVLPGTGLLQLMFKAALARSATWPVELRDVVLAAPLVADGTRRVRVRVRPLGSSRRIIVDSRPEPSADAWTEHATATWVEATVRRSSRAPLSVFQTTSTASPCLSPVLVPLRKIVTSPPRGSRTGSVSRGRSRFHSGRATSFSTVSNVCGFSFGPGTLCTLVPISMIGAAGAPFPLSTSNTR